MAASPNNSGQAPVIIIRKKKGGGHAGHHGGAWKVAYADFVTAMMSFFLLLWLLNVTTDVERKGIADYFAPASISKSESGAGGVMGGQTIATSGAQMSVASPPSNQDVTIPTVGKGDEGDEETKGQSQNSAENPNNKTNPNNVPATKEEAAVAVAMKSEEENFKQAESILKQAIASNPDLKQFANQIVIDRTPEGLRIQIIDRDRFSMFPSASAIPFERARDLIKLVGRVVAQLPNNLSITGHTDSTPFLVGAGRDNWTLSTERANVSRQYLVEAGVAENRIARVSGLSDRDPFVPEDAKDPRNRRISIVLLRKSLAPVDAQKSPAADK
jgi:chemotaxis protein MotB